MDVAGAVDYFLSSPTAGGWLCSCHRYQLNLLVGPALQLSRVEGSGAGGEAEAGTRFWGLQYLDGVPASPVDYFLGCGFAAQELPSPFHHRLRGQLIQQHLELNGVMERMVHAGSLERGQEVRGPGSLTAR